MHLSTNMTINVAKITEIYIVAHHLLLVIFSKLLQCRSELCGRELNI